MLKALSRYFLVATSESGVIGIIPYWVFRCWRGLFRLRCACSETSLICRCSRGYRRWRRSIAVSCSFIVVRIAAETTVGIISSSVVRSGVSVIITKRLAVVSESCRVGIGTSGCRVILSHYIDSSVILSYIVRYTVVVIVIHVLAIVVTIVSVISTLSVVRLWRIVISVVVIGVIVRIVVGCVAVCIGNTRSQSCCED